jgi:hypothetical protein
MVSMGFVNDPPTNTETDLVFTDAKLSDPHHIESVIIALISKLAPPPATVRVGLGLFGKKTGATTNFFSCSLLLSASG